MKRAEGESFEDYKKRRKLVNNIIKQRLKGKSFYPHPNPIDIYDGKAKRVPYVKEKEEDNGE